jgi:hypothetical protein
VHDLGRLQAHDVLVIESRDDTDFVAERRGAGFDDALREDLQRHAHAFDGIVSLIHVGEAAPTEQLLDAVLMQQVAAAKRPLAASVSGRDRRHTQLC